MPPARSPAPAHAQGEPVGVVASPRDLLELLLAGDAVEEDRREEDWLLDWLGTGAGYCRRGGEIGVPLLVGHRLLSAERGTSISLTR